MTSNKTRNVRSRNTLGELSMNNVEDDDDREDPTREFFGNIDGQVTLRLTPELKRSLFKEKVDLREFINSNLSETLDHLEIVGWSGRGAISPIFYDRLLTNDLKAKTLTLRGRGEWTTCCCPTAENKNGELIDTITPERTTQLEHLNIFRTFKITSCALLDLISRSPKLKTVRFYGVIYEDTHYEPFLSVRFLSDLEAVYWPWCNVKAHKPTLRTLVKRNSQIETLYTSADIACDFINSDLLPNLKYLSLIMNEQWLCSPGKTRVLKRYNRNIQALRRADKIEALEIRTFDVNHQIAMDSSETADPETHDLIRNNFETYKLSFWENVKDLPNLKYLAVYGAWELEEVTREMSKHGLQIEYFRTNLMPNSILSNLEDNIDNTSKNLILSMTDAAKHLAKLAKLKSLHFTCHDYLNNIDDQTASAMITLSDLIWKFEIKSKFTSEVEELMKNILRRGMQNGRSYRIRMLIEPEDPSFAHLYAESIEKHTGSEFSLKDNLTEKAREQMRSRFGKTSFKTYSVWGIEQNDRARDTETFNQLTTAWNLYERIFRPLDMFI